MSRIINVKGRSVVVPEEADYESAAYDGVWYPICTHCGSETPAEPDAQRVVCQTCEKEVELYSIA